MIDLPARQRLARVALAVALVIAGIWVASPFLPALFWAIVLAVAIDPLYTRAAERWPGGKPVALPLLFTIAAALAVLTPVALGLLQAAREAHALSQWLAETRANGIPVPPWVDQLPFGRASVREWWTLNLATPEAAQRQFGRLSDPEMLKRSRVLGGHIFHRSVIFAFTLLAFFFVLREKERFRAQALRAGDRLFGPAGERIGVQMIRSVRGTIDGLVLVGIGEGVIMAVGYVLAGVPHPILMGALTAVAAMIPFGAAVLIGLAALLLVAQGATAWALAIVILGVVVVFVADHFIRPVMIGGAIRLPFLWVLVGILGGVESFGLVGLFIGPAVMAALIMLWRELIAGERTAPAASEGPSDAEGSLAPRA